MTKNLIFGSDLGPFGPNLGRKFFFQICGSVSHKISRAAIVCTISGKTNDPILRKLSNGRTDGQTNAQE